MTSTTLRFDPRVFPLGEGAGPSLAHALARLAGRRMPLLLDSAGGALGDSAGGALGDSAGGALGDSAGGAAGRWSVLAFDPLVETIVPAEDRRDAGEILEGLRGALRSLAPAGGRDVPGPFAGGWAGALAYDLGVAGERLALPDEPWRMPLVVGGLYTDFLVRDERSGEAWLVLGDEPGDGRPPADERRAEIADALARPAEPGGLSPAGPLVRHVPAAEHRARIERARAYIAEGEIYQANLAHRFTRAVDGEPVALYLRLRERNPAPFMGFLDWTRARGAPPGALLSSSPELLIELADGRARTRPIKGTAPRGGGREEDERSARALLASEKDRAELGMIVDLERNDLGRVARPGSVRVDGFPTLESYATVHHLVADVVADVRPDVDAFGVLASLFPGGSITGAPKLRSMEVIAELEGEGRGFFTGSLGFVDLRGRSLFNVLIRTMLWRPREARGERDPNGARSTRGEVSFRVGGGITWSSDAAAEDQETLHKGAALAAATEGGGPDAPGPPSTPPGGSLFSAS